MNFDTLFGINNKYYISVVDVVLFPADLFSLDPVLITSTFKSLSLNG